MPVSEVAFDWQRIGEYEDEKGFKFDAVLLIAIPQDLIKKYQKIFKEAWSFAYGFRNRAN
ncbi:MAG: hypothetical protein KatS3mg093_292 [Candidatus Parcubacteria bacterium]|nr:MAG: hypothetical protein KatS3mg093_292 [Candidatus Parcubacteria bacterium]